MEPDNYIGEDNSDNIEESPEEQLDNDGMEDREQGVLEGYLDYPDDEEEEEKQEDDDFTS